MIRYLLAVLSVFPLSIPTTGTVSGQQVESGQTFTGKVAAVTDEDTCDAWCPDGQLVMVCLQGVSAREPSKPRSKVARELVEGG